MRLSYRMAIAHYGLRRLQRVTLNLLGRSSVRLRREFAMIFLRF
jgi:hypothetical protein